MTAVWSVCDVTSVSHAAVPSVAEESKLLYPSVTGHMYATCVPPLNLRKRPADPEGPHQM